MPKDYFEFKGFDYFPVFGVARARLRFNEERGQSPDIKISFDEFSTYASAQALGCIILVAVIGNLEKLAR